MTIHFKSLRCAVCGFKMTSAVSISDVELQSFERTHSRHAPRAMLLVGTYDRAVSLTAIHDEESLDSATRRGAIAVPVEQQQAMGGALLHRTTGPTKTLLP